ncbi:MAG: ammonium transporter [Cyanobacteria bacterium J06632_22]
MDDHLLDLTWILWSSCLVFLMQAGFLCLEAGATRPKNRINVVIKNFTDLNVSVLIFWLVGYGLMFGTSYLGWVGHSDYLFTTSQPGDPAQTAWNWSFFLFQAMFCSTAVTIVSGAVAERMTLRSYLAVCVLISGLLYPVFGHWVWNGLATGDTHGWLGQKGFVDFAGSTVVHSLGGWSALAAVIVVGPRLGRYSTKRLFEQVSGADIPLTFLGTMILWFGWFGFNGGSELAFDNQVPLILLNTLFAGCAGGLLPVGLALLRHRPIAATAPLNGALAGLVAITAGCHVVSVESAIAIGAIGCWVMLLTEALLNRWHIDDVVGAIPVHLGAGIWGTLAVALFGDVAQLGTGLSRIEQLTVQLSGVLACGVWTFSLTLFVMLGLQQVMALRVSARQEYVGLNMTEHGAKREISDVYQIMRHHAKTGNLSKRVSIDPFTEVGIIGTWYNQVISALEQAIAKNEAIVNTAADGILTTSTFSLSIQSANPATENIFGYTTKALIDRPLKTLLVTDPQKSDQPLSETALRELLWSATKRGQALELFGRTQAGQTFPLEMMVTATQLHEESFFTILLRDITARKSAEAALKFSEWRERAKSTQLNETLKQLKQTQTQLIQAERMSGLGQLVAGIAHEVNNPISFIHGNLEYAKAHVEDLLFSIEHYRQHSGTLPDEIQSEVDSRDLDYISADFPKLIQSMFNGTKRIKEIVDSLRTFSRLDEAELKIVDIHDGLDAALMLLARQQEATESLPAISVVKAYGSLPPVECYSGALNQVFVHILTNAFESLRQVSTSNTSVPAKLKLDGSPQVTIKTAALSDKEIYVAISDNGPGISKGIQKLIFDPFFSTKPIGQGKGLGLSISYQIVVDQHGGCLKCESVPGEKTEFTVILPTVVSDKA